MAIITTRLGKGSPLTISELDTNFINLNTDKIESVSEDTSPVLGGTLDANSNGITNLDNITSPTTTFDIREAGLISPVAIRGIDGLVLQADASSITLVKGPNGNINITPSGGGSVVIDGNAMPQTVGLNGQVLTTNGAGQLSFTTLASITSSDVTTALGYTPENIANKAVANGYASLNGSGIVPTAQLPVLTSVDVTTALTFTPEDTANKGVANGYASLDVSGLVPASQLPSFVDDVLEFANLAALPVTGETSKIYVTLDTNRTYRWSGSVYVEISASPGSTDEVTEGATNLYFTTARARNSISVSGSLSYNATTGVISYTSQDLSGYALTASLATVATSGLYSDLTGAPTNVSAFGNDAGYITISSVISNFTGLSDTPSSYATNGGFFVRVNQAENALEFIQDIDDGAF